MGLFDWFSSDSGDSLLGNAADSLGLGSLGGLVTDAAAGLSGFQDRSSEIVPASYSYAEPTMAEPVRQLLPVPSGGLVGGLAARFPQLYTAIMSYRSRGIKIGAESLYSMLKKFGPNFLISAGLLSAAAISELMMYKATRKRRRMNPLNPRALNRSTRRLVSFQHRASKIQAVLSHLGARRSRGRSRCFKCKRNPCAC